MKYITSRSNALVKRAIALHNKKGREKYDAFLTEGFILIEEAIRAGLSIEQLFLRGESPENEVKDLVCGLLYDVDIVHLTESIFDEIADTVTPQGVLATVKMPAKTQNCMPDSLLVLDRIQDPGNVGTLIRTAYAAGVGMVAAIKGTTDPWSLKAIRSSAGALFHLPVLTYADANESIRELREEGYAIRVLHASGGCAYYEQDMTGRVAIVVGNEGNGIGDEFLAAADAIVSIPMDGESESLNVAIAAGIVMYERRRQIYLKQGQYPCVK